MITQTMLDATQRLRMQGQYARMLPQAPFYGNQTFLHTGEPLFQAGDMLLQDGKPHLNPTEPHFNRIKPRFNALLKAIKALFKSVKALLKPVEAILQAVDHASHAEKRIKQIICGNTFSHASHSHIFKNATRVPSAR